MGARARWFYEFATSLTTSHKSNKIILKLRFFKTETVVLRPRPKNRETSEPTPKTKIEDFFFFRNESKGFSENVSRICRRRQINIWSHSALIGFVDQYPTSNYLKVILGRPSSSACPMESTPWKAFKGEIKTRCNDFSSDKLCSCAVLTPRPCAYVFIHDDGMEWLRNLIFLYMFWSVRLHKLL